MSRKAKPKRTVPREWLLIPLAVSPAIVRQEAMENADYTVLRTASGTVYDAGGMTPSQLLELLERPDAPFCATSTGPSN